MSQESDMNNYLRDLKNDPSLIHDSYFMCCLSNFSMLPYDFMEKYVDYLDWYEICMYRHMSIDFMTKPNILPHIRFEVISSHQRLNEKFIEKYKDKLDWNLVCGNQKLSEQFLIKHMEDLVIEPLLYNKKAETTDNFWRTLFTLSNDIEINGKWMPQRFCKPFSINLIREFRNRFPYLNGRMIDSRDNKLWKEFEIKGWNR